MAFDSGFHMTLPSNASLDLFPDNTLASYRTKLAQRVDLDGDDWEVGLAEINYVRNWYNVSRGEYIDMDVGFRSFYYFPYYGLLEEDVDIKQRAEHLVNFLNKQMAPFIMDWLKFIAKEDGTIAIVDSVSTRSRISVSRSLCLFLNWIPHDPKKASVDLLEWEVKPFTGGEFDYNDGNWWITIRAAQPTYRVYVPSGYYSKPEELMDTINKLLVWDVKEDRRFILTYSSVTKKVTFNAPKPHYLLAENMNLRRELFGIKFNPALAGLLGFHDPYQIYGELTVEAPHTIDMEAGLTTIYVHCDIIRDSLVGNALAPLLRAVQIRGGDGDFVNEIFVKPYYRQLARTNFETVHIYLTDDVGEIIPFQTGRVSVTLHFRRRL